ncbi:MAG TPA: dockerin type I repeat-containing protein, partial [Ruminococcus sp.]|nr:dockerin type I repeat-containing protein [Ruminococcus sp.]
PADEPAVTYSGSEEPDEESIRGDVNADKVFDLNDLVAMQNWLLAKPNSDLADWKAGDLCDDDKISLYDLIAMRQLFLGE